MKSIAKTLMSMLLLVSYAKAQTISGKVYDSTDNKSIPFAVVAVLKPVDSFLVKFTRSNKDGDFELKNVPPGKYIFMITHPYYGDFLDDVTTTTDGLNLHNVKVIPKTKLLQEVIIKNGGAMRIKGDTVSYTADSFKVGPNANVEELLKKLPGITVDKDGKIKAMGEQVQKVLVDGEEFFGDDPGMAVKNLRADAVKEVQVYDKKSDQAEFTGIDDGQKQKTINLKLKDDRKKGYFGKIDAAGGPLKKIDNRYNTNIMFNAFKGKRKLAIFSLNGNTGQDGLAWQDRDKYGSDADDVSMSMDDEGQTSWQWRGSNDEEPDVNTENGFIINNNIGLHYSNKWNDKQTLSISPKYNRQVYDNLKTNFQQTQLKEDSISYLNDYSTSKQHVNRYNFINSVTYDVKIDSSNSLKIYLKGNFYHTENTEETNGTKTSNTGTIKNTRESLLNQNIDKSSLTTTAIFRHKFKKLRRTFSLNVDWNRLQSDANNYLKSDNEIYANGVVDSSIIKDQMFETDKVTQKLSSKATYTEPLSKKFSLELAYELIYSRGKNNRITYNYSTFSGKYDDLVDTLSNNFDQTITINKPSAKISYNFKKLKFNFGAGFGYTSFNFTDLTMAKDYKRNYVNAFPAASLTYTYKANHSVNFSYNGNTAQPTLNQLQPLRISDDPLNVYLGNQFLRPSFTHSFNISHQSFNFLKELWMYQGFNIRSVANSITNSYIIDASTGKTTTQPINTNGNFSLNFWGGVNYKLKKLKMNIDISPNAGYYKNTDVVNGQFNQSKTFNGGLRLGLYKSSEKKYDISVSNNFNYNRNTTTQNNNVNSYFTNSVNVYATVYYKKVWSLTTDYNFMSRQKTQQFQDNLTNSIWNARFQKTFKDNEFTAYVMVRDILNQNIGVDRNYSGITTTEETNQRLKRYFMIGFTWDFKNAGSKPAPKTP